MKIEQIHYPELHGSAMHETLDFIMRYSQLAAEFGEGEKSGEILQSLRQSMQDVMETYQSLALSCQDPDEPDDLESIRALRPDGPRRLCEGIPSDYASRLRGALNGRMAGCTLGAALEFHPTDDAKNWAEHFGDDYP